jgi:hypothetical protein
VWITRSYRHSPRTQPFSIEYAVIGYLVGCFGQGSSIASVGRKSASSFTRPGGWHAGRGYSTTLDLRVHFVQ